MPWILQHAPAGEEWEKRFPTKKAAVEELQKHICPECMSGEMKYVDSSQPGCFGIEKRKPPRADNARDLLSTPCGCEYELEEVAADKPTQPWERLGSGRQRP